MISLTAQIQPISRSAIPLIALLARRLRGFDHVVCGPGQLIANVPSLGSVLVTETATQMTLNIVTESAEDAAATRLSVSREVTAAAGSRASAKMLTITWTQLPSVPALLR